jgi:hypothetical protein
MEPARKLTAQEITSRVCEHFGFALVPFLKSQEAAEVAGPNPLPVGP